MITMGKKFKKTMAMAMATAMAFSIPALPVYQAEKVEAAKVKEAEATSKFSSVDLYEDYEQLYVQQNEDDTSDILYYAVTKKDKDGKVKYPKESAYEAVEFDNKTAVVDLSWISRNKEQVLCIATGASIEEIKPQTIDLKAQDVVKATYSGTIDDKEKEADNVVGNDDEGYLTFTTGAKSEPKAVSTSAIQYRTTNGNWGSVDYIDLAYYSKKGATLQMRVAPNNNTATPAGKIVNVKIKAKSKAPKVTINYNDKTVSVPKKVQYSLDAGKTWSEAVDKKVNESLGMYDWNGTTDKTVYFRTAGDAKKSASKIKYLTIKKEATEFAALTAPVSGSAVIAELPEVGSGKIDMRYKTAYLNTSGLVFTNATNDMYQVAFAKKADIKDYVTDAGTTLKAVSSSAIVAKAAKKVTWATVTAQDVEKKKVGTGKLSLKKGENLDDYVILYRICDKKGATVNSEVRIFDVPGVVKQSVTLMQDNKEVTKVEIASGTATEGKDAVVTVTGSGITSDRAKYTTKVYSDKACTTVYTNIAATYTAADKSLKVASKAKATPGTYYVKVSVEGTSTILEVVVK